MSKILKKIGLTKEQVTQAVGLPTMGECSVAVVQEPGRYLCGTDQKRIRTRMKEYSTFIVARYLEGWHPGTISRILSVSEESVRNNLRKNGVFSRSKPGRPSKSDSSLQENLL